MAIPPHTTGSSAAIAARASPLRNPKSPSSARSWARFEQLPPVRGFRCEIAEHHIMPPQDFVYYHHPRTPIIRALARPAISLATEHAPNSRETDWPVYTVNDLLPKNQTTHDASIPPHMPPCLFCMGISNLFHRQSVFHSVQAGFAPSACVT